jgi:hypothetical protein
MHLGVTILWICSRACKRNCAIQICCTEISYYLWWIWGSHSSDCDRRPFDQNIHSELAIFLHNNKCTLHMHIISVPRTRKENHGRGITKAFCHQVLTHQAALLTFFRLCLLPVSSPASKYVLTSSSKFLLLYVVVFPNIACLWVMAMA